jgi:hypothetical protein
MNKKHAIIVALVLLTGFVVYKVNTQDEPVDAPVPVYGGAPGTAVLLPDPVYDAGVIEITTPIVIRTGTKLCQWYEDAGMSAMSNVDGWAEATCHGDTCFLLVHETEVPAGWVMAAWISEARREGRDPRKDNVQLSVFTFKDGEETDHVIYFPHLDVFERR